MQTKHRLDEDNFISAARSQLSLQPPFPGSAHAVASRRSTRTGSAGLPERRTETIYGALEMMPSNPVIITGNGSLHHANIYDFMLGV